MSIAVSLLKVRYHLSFTAVVAGALLFAPEIDARLGVRLTLLYLTFNVLLYGGIYAFNDVADRKTDAAHPGKRLRPVASGQLSVRGAVALAGALVVAGLLLAGLLFPMSVVLSFGAAVAINAVYSCGGRNVPYVDILLNGAPHPLRFLLGVLLVGHTPPAGHLAAWLCLACGIACVRRLVEKDALGESSRPTLAWYSEGGLVMAMNFGLLAVLTLATLDGLTSPGFYALVLTGYVLLVMGGRWPAYRRSLGAWLWLR